jgi:hypothetical protein
MASNSAYRADDEVTSDMHSERELLAFSVLNTQRPLGPLVWLRGRTKTKMPLSFSGDNVLDNEAQTT